MAVTGKERSRILAVLGPTNTGKTHFAVERMLAHRSGMIGFPLRLLAREIYDRIVAERGVASVALITGEERIAPPTARYFVATVEAMPLDRRVSFLAVDEIQLAADLERGHVFTDRLLNARGDDETLFLGADTVRPLLKQLVPEAEVVTRPRFSTLSYAAPSKVTRLPRRSAVVAFTARDVYALAEVVRRHRGGAAVVLGALSPRTRNAQVALYQAGEVDYLIATDAIGMGLNMDLQHVTLASLHKFDGREYRRLHAQEVGQIAGRAGRHMRDGTFGTTHEAGGLDARTVEAVESHDFAALKQLRWRNSALGFDTLDELLASLDAPPPHRALIKARDAIDDLSLKLLARREPIRKRATSPATVRLLWSVCQIPDFRKTLTESHLHLLDTVFRNLAEAGRVPTDWVADQVARLDRTDGDIDSLINRLAHIRTWTYVAYRADWLEEALHWQERTRAVEDRLSDALHDRLTQRFVDRRTQALLKSLQGGEPLAAVEADGAVLVDGHQVGEMQGLCYTLERTTVDLERRTLHAAAKRALGPELRRRAKALTGAPDEAFVLDDQGLILWRIDGGEKGTAAVARLRPGATPLTPRIELLVADSLGRQAQEAIRQRLAQWLDAHLARAVQPLRRLQASDLEGPGRALAFLLVEGLGNVRTGDARTMLGVLGAADRAELNRHGVRFGVRHVYMPAMLKTATVQLRARLFAIHHRQVGVTPPAPGRVALPEDAEVPKGFAEATGFERLGAWRVRIDIVERIAARLRSLNRAGPFVLEPDLMSLSGLSGTDLAGVVEALGYAQGEDGRFVRRKGQRRKGGRRKPTKRSSTEAAKSPFAALEHLKRSG